MNVRSESDADPGSMLTQRPYLQLSHLSAFLLPTQSRINRVSRWESFRPPPARRSKRSLEVAPSSSGRRCTRGDLIEDHVGDARDRLVRELGVQPGPVVLDVAHRNPADVEADDHLLQATRRLPLSTSRGSKLPARSRGVSRSNAPTPDWQRLRGVDLFRDFGSRGSRVAPLIAQVVGWARRLDPARATGGLDSSGRNRGHWSGQVVCIGRGHQRGLESLAHHLSSRETRRLLDDAVTELA